MNLKTMELLLENYKNIHKGILKDCAEKQKFTDLISELELKMKQVVVYPDGMTVLEYAKKLAKEANERYETEHE